MKILSIETSCDETAICLVETSGAYPNTRIIVLGSVLLSQAELHAEYGGVFPNLARREHVKNLVPILAKVFKNAGWDKESTSLSDNTRADIRA